MATLISDIVDFRANNITGQKEGDFIIIKGSVHQEDILILNIYVPNNKASKYVKQKLINLQGERDKSTITDRDLMPPLNN